MPQYRLAIFILIFLSVFSTQYPQEIKKQDEILINQNSENSEKHFFIGIKGGRRFNNGSEYASNTLYGFLTEIPLSEYFSLQPELNLWGTISEINMLLMINKNINKVGFSLILGIGLVHNELIGGAFGTRLWWDSSKYLRIFTSFRYQGAGSLESGGGESISSIMLELGFDYCIWL